MGEKRVDANQRACVGVGAARSVHYPDRKVSSYAVVDVTVSHVYASNPVFQAYHKVIIFGSGM